MSFAESRGGGEGGERERESGREEGGGGADDDGGVGGWGGGANDRRRIRSDVGGSAILKINTLESLFNVSMFCLCRAKRLLYCTYICWEVCVCQGFIVGQEIYVNIVKCSEARVAQMTLCVTVAPVKVCKTTDWKHTQPPIMNSHPPPFS